MTKQWTPSNENTHTLIIDGAICATVERLHTNDLKANVTLDLYIAVLGGEIQFKTFRGMVNVKIAPETQPNTQKKLKGLGMPKHNSPGEFGDLYLTFNVTIPTNVTQKEKDLFEKLAKLRK